LVSSLFSVESVCSADLVLQLLFFGRVIVRPERHSRATSCRHSGKSVRDCRLPTWQRQSGRRQDVDDVALSRRRRWRRHHDGSRAQRPSTDQRRLGHGRVFTVLTQFNAYGRWL